MRRRDIRTQRKDKRTRYVDPRTLEREAEEAMARAFEQLAQERKERPELVLK